MSNITAKQQGLIDSAVSATADAVSAIGDAKTATATATEMVSIQYDALATAIYGPDAAPVAAVLAAIQAGVKVSKDDLGKSALPTSATAMKYWAMTGKVLSLPNTGKDSNGLGLTEIQTLVTKVAGPQKPSSAPAGFSVADTLKGAKVPYGMAAAEAAVLKAKTKAEAVKALEQAEAKIKAAVNKAIAEAKAKAAAPKSQEHYLKAAKPILTKAGQVKAADPAAAAALIAEIEGILATLKK